MDLLPAIGATPWLLPVVAAALALGVAVAGPAGRRLGAPPLLVVALVTSLGLVLGATLTPGLGDTFSQGTCLAGLDGSLRGADWFRNDLARNLLLPLPLGVCIGLLRPPHRRWLAVLALLLPPAVEAVQLVVPTLGRACQVTDAGANLLGLLAGLLLGALLAWPWHRRGRRRSDRHRPEGGSRP